MSQALHFLIDRAKTQAEEASLAMARVQKYLQDAKHKLSLLEEYRDDSLNRATPQVNSQVHRVGLQTQMAFMGKIDEALTQQQREIENLHHTLVEKTQTYQKHLAEQKKFEAVIKRQELRAQKQEAKRDQKMNDEFAARIHRQTHA